MQYFKHYHNADSSTFIQKLINDHGLVAYAQWFLMLELLCEKFDGEATLIELTRSEVALKLRIKSGRVDVVLKWFSSLLDNQTNSTDFILKIDAPILLCLQDKDFKYATKVRREKGAKNKNKEERIKKKNKIKSIDVFGPHEKLVDDFNRAYLEKVKIKTQESWLATYSDHDWLKQQIHKSIAWLINNDEVRKNMGSYITGWLGRTRPETRTYSGTKSSSGKDYAARMMDAYEGMVANG